MRLYEESRNTRIQSRGQPVDEHIVDVFRQLRGVVVAGGQHVPVGNEEEALVFVLKRHPVLQRAVVVTQRQPAGGSHAREHARAGSSGAQLIPRMASRPIGSEIDTAVLMLVFGGPEL